MFEFLAKKKLAQFESHYRYDATYMHRMLEISPSAFFKYAKLMDVAAHRESAPVEAFYAAKLVGALAEDCGPCTQLCVDMAMEAGVSDDQIEAVLTRNRMAMNETTALGYAFADAVVRRSENEDEAREAVRAQWGDKGVIDLTLGVQIGRIFPMVKAGLGYAKTCQRVRIGKGAVDVVKEAA
jgi:alkylhydroperoxidase family enzyme